MKKEVDALEKLYAYILWLVPKLEKFPRNQKFLLGDRMESLVLDIMELLIEAVYSREKRMLLSSANIKLEKMRYLVRLAKDMRLINTKAYGYSAEALNAVGTSVGAWLRYANT